MWETLVLLETRLQVADKAECGTELRDLCRFADNDKELCCSATRSKQCASNYQQDNSSRMWTKNGEGMDGERGQCSE